MNKKLIALFTGISLSALAVGALSLAKVNNGGFVKTTATEKTVKLDKTKSIYCADGEGMFDIEDDIITGSETYIHANIIGFDCDYINSPDHFLSIANGCYNNEIDICFDVRGLTFFEIRGTATNPDGYENGYHITYTSYVDLGGDSMIDDGTIINVALNDVYKDTVSSYNTERVIFRFDNIGTLNISKIELTMSCETN